MPDRPAHLAGFARFCQANSVRPVSAGSARAGTTPPPKLLRRLEERAVSAADLADRAARGSPSPATSRSPATASGCIPPSATAPQPRRSSQRQSRDQLPEELSKIVDTAQIAPGSDVAESLNPVPSVRVTGM